MCGVKSSLFAEGNRVANSRFINFVCQNLPADDSYHLYSTSRSFFLSFFASSNHPHLHLNTISNLPTSSPSLEENPMLYSRAPSAYSYSAYMSTSATSTPYASLPTYGTREIQSSSQEIHTRAAQELDSVLAQHTSHNHYSESFERARRSDAIAEAMTWLSSHSRQGT